jgi:hypothetical protein
MKRHKNFMLGLTNETMLKYIRKRPIRQPIHSPFYRFAKRKKQPAPGLEKNLEHVL